MTKTLEELAKELAEAKKNVLWLLEHNGLVDMKGISYWASVVEERRQEIEKSL